MTERTRHVYRVQVFREEGWVTILEDSSRLYCWGYMEGRRSMFPPRLAHRLARGDGKVHDEFAASDDVPLGMIAGFPTPEQYERAAEEALRKARLLREAAARREERRRRNRNE